MCLEIGRWQARKFVIVAEHAIDIGHVQSPGEILFHHDVVNLRELLSGVREDVLGYRSRFGSGNFNVATTRTVMLSTVDIIGCIFARMGDSTFSASLLEALVKVLVGKGKEVVHFFCCTRSHKTNCAHKTLF